MQRAAAWAVRTNSNRPQQHGDTINPHQRDKIAFCCAGYQSLGVVGVCVCVCVCVCKLQQMAVKPTTVPPVLVISILSGAANVDTAAPSVAANRVDAALNAANPCTCPPPPACPTSSAVPARPVSERSFGSLSLADPPKGILNLHPILANDRCADAALVLRQAYSKLPLNG